MDVRARARDHSRYFKQQETKLRELDNKKIIERVGRLKVRDLNCTFGFKVNPQRSEMLQLLIPPWSFHAYEGLSTFFCKTVASTSLLPFKFYTSR
jgi:hypothetical protein